MGDGSENEEPEKDDGRLLFYCVELGSSISHWIDRMCYQVSLSRALYVRSRSSTQLLHDAAIILMSSVPSTGAEKRVLVQFAAKTRQVYLTLQKILLRRWKPPRKQNVLLSRDIKLL